MVSAAEVPEVRADVDRVAAGRVVSEASVDRAVVGKADLVVPVDPAA